MSTSPPTAGGPATSGTYDGTSIFSKTRPPNTQVESFPLNQPVKSDGLIAPTDAVAPAPIPDGPGASDDDAVLRQHVRTFLERLPEIQKQLMQAETAPNIAEAEFTAKLMPITMELRAACGALKDDYKTKNEMGVHRASKRPQSTVRHRLAMLGFIGLEALINGAFLAVGEEGGLVMGWLIALGISLFNVYLMGFRFGGRLLRQKNHRQISHKLLGALGLCAVLAIAYSSNLLVAHYRDALGGPDPDNAGTTALKVWLANPVNPLMVGGVESLWLLCLGITFTLIGLADGYFSDDPYPGYGQFYVEHTERLANYHSLFQKSFADLHEVEQAQDSQLGYLADEINKRLNIFLRLKARYASKPEDPDFDAWKRIEQGFPEDRVNRVLIQLTDKRSQILDKYTTAMNDLEKLDPTINGEA